MLRNKSSGCVNWPLCTSCCDDEYALTSRFDFEWCVVLKLELFGDDRVRIGYVPPISLFVNLCDVYGPAASNSIWFNHPYFLTVISNTYLLDFSKYSGKSHHFYSWDGDHLKYDIFSPFPTLSWRPSGLCERLLNVRNGSDFHLSREPILKITSQWAFYQIHKTAGCACAGNAGNVFPATEFKGNR